MIKAILLDLDNSLLINPDRSFALAFMSVLEEAFKGPSQQTSVHAFRDAIQALGHRQTGTLSNQSYIENYLSQQTGIALAEITSIFSDFYQVEFSRLSQQTQIQPFAANLLRQLREAGFAVVIATNPLYPMSAIRKKLIWAGLPVDESCYNLVTSADNMHFAKPDPAYYAEIIGRLGIEPDEAIMIGDSLRNDIQPAQNLGLHTYHIREGNQQVNDENYGGTLEDFAAWINSPNWREQFQRPNLTPNMIEPQLRGNTGALFGMLEGINPDFWEQHPDPEEWSILEIVCHLIESENQTQRARMQRILASDNPFIAETRMPDPRMSNCSPIGSEALQKFVSERNQTLKLLEQIKTMDWGRPARHSIFGNTNLLEMVYFTAQHDRLHLNQICQTLGRCE